MFIGLGYMNYVLRKHDTLQIAVVIGLLVLGAVTMVAGVHYDIVMLRAVGLSEFVICFTDLATLIVYTGGRERPLGGDNL